MSYITRKLSVEVAVNAAAAQETPPPSKATIDNQIAVLKKMGFTNGEQIAYFDAEVKANPGLKKVFADFEKDFASGTKYDALLGKIGKQVLADGEKVKFDTTAAKKSGTGIIDKLAADLAGKSGAQMVTQLRTDPTVITEKMDKYAAGTIGIAEMLPAAAAAKATAPAAKAAAPTAAAPPAPTVAKKAHVAAAPAVAPIAAAVSTPTPTAPTDAPAAPSDPTATAAAADPAEQVLTALAEMSNEDIKKELTRDDIKLILNGMADQAGSKYGVESSTVSGFKQRVAEDTELVDDITTNFQNNPDFVRQLAKAAKDKTPMNKTMQNMAKGTMTTVMENPEKLAEDAYVKDLNQKMNMGSKMAGFGKILDSIFGPGVGGQIAGWFSAIFDQIKGFFSQFTGEKSVISMRSGGQGSLLPTAMLNVDNMRYNKEAAEAQANYSPRQMTALTTADKDGKFFHNGEQLKDKDGKPVLKNDKPVYEQIPNGQITLKTADGKDFKGIPSVGALSAIELQNGNVRVPIVEAIDAKGAATKVTQITMTREAFDDYKKIADAKGQERGGAIKSLTLETLEDRTVRAPLTVKMASVDPSTGAVAPLTTIDAATGKPVQPGLQKSEVETFPVRPHNDPSSNERDYKLQG